MKCERAVPCLRSWPVIPRCTSTSWGAGANDWRNRSSSSPESSRGARSWMSAAEPAPSRGHRQSAGRGPSGWMPRSPFWTALGAFDPMPMSSTYAVTHPGCSSRTARSTCASRHSSDVVPDVDLFAAEMRRVTRARGVVACCTFDFWGGNSALDLVLDTGAVLDERIRTLRAQIKARPIVWASGQADLWRQTGLVDVVESAIVLSFDYTDFEDYWSSWATGPARIAQCLMALPSESRDEIEQHVRTGYLAGLSDGPRSFAAVVRAVRGTVPRAGSAIPRSREELPATTG